MADETAGVVPNQSAWIGPLRPDVAVPMVEGSHVTGVCRSCGRALFGGPGGWHDVRGWENCPYPWPGESVFHEPILTKPVEGECGCYTFHEFNCPLQSEPAAAVPAGVGRTPEPA